MEMAALHRSRWLLSLCSAAFVSATFACDPVPSYKAFQPEVLRPSATPSAPPKVSVERIQRGHAGNNSCDDLAWLTLKVPTGQTGYSFEVVDSEFASVFPEGFVQPITDGFFRFHWADGGSDLQEPLNFVLKITTMSTTGTLSEPLFLRIEDPGRGAAR
jgi:hypothetical protein